MNPEGLRTLLGIGPDAELSVRVLPGVTIASWDNGHGVVNQRMYDPETINGWAAHLLNLHPDLLDNVDVDDGHALAVVMADITGVVLPEPGENLAAYLDVVKLYAKIEDTAREIRSS